MASFLGHNSLHTLFRGSKIPFSQNPKPLKYKVTYASLPATDRVIDFGKYKGRMLGTLPSTYLKWVSNNLRARDFEEWAKLADQVLEDPVYKDRVEWEYAEKLLNGDVLNANSKSDSVVVDLLEVSQRFGWDNEDKIGWSKIDFQLLGTSKGGRIPRVNGEKRGGKEDRDMERRWKGQRSEVGKDEEVGMREKRVERRERLKMKRENKGYNNVVKKEDEGSKYKKRTESMGHDAEVYNPFPGRESLLRKVLNRRGNA